MPNQRNSLGSITFSIDGPDISCIIPERNYPSRDPQHSRENSNIVDEIFAHFGYVRSDSTVPLKIHDRNGSVVVVQDLTPKDEEDDENDDVDSVFSEDFGHKPKLSLRLALKGDWSTDSCFPSPQQQEAYYAMLNENYKLREELKEMRHRNSQLEEENSLLQTALDTAIQSKEAMLATVSDAFNRVREKFVGRVWSAV